MSKLLLEPRRWAAFQAAGNLWNQSCIHGYIVKYGNTSTPRIARWIYGSRRAETVSANRNSQPNASIGRINRVHEILWVGQATPTGGEWVEAMEFDQSELSTFRKYCRIFFILEDA